LANDKEDQQRALQKREEHMRRSSADERDSYASGQFTDEEDDDTTPLERRLNHREWYTTRWGDLKKHLSDETTRQEFVEGEYVVKHRGRTYDRDFQSVTNRCTPSPETRAAAEDPSPTPDVDVNEVTLGAYGDKPLEVRPGVVVPAGYYIVIDGASGDRYEAAQAYQEWYGFYGAEHHMQVGSIARPFPWIPGEDQPVDRAHSMEKDLRRQSESLRPPTREEMQERYV
jgi:hypothetical protein